MTDNATRDNIRDGLEPDLLELLAAGRPLTAPSDDVLNRARQALAAHTGTGETSPSRRTVIAAAVAAAATVTGVSIAPKLMSSGLFGDAVAPVLPTPTAAHVYGKYTPGGEYSNLAAQILTLGLPDWRSAGFWYLHCATKGGKARSMEWIGHRSPGRVEQPGHPTENRPPATYSIGPENLDWDALWSLPTDARLLEQRLRGGYLVSGGYDDDDPQIWINANELVALSPAPPVLRSALFQVLSTLPGLIVHNTRDRAGRSGMSFERKVDGLALSYVYDPETGTLLEKRVDDGSTRAVTTFLDIGWVDSDTVPPGPANRLPRPATTDESQSLGGPFGPYSIYSPAPATS